MVERLNGTWKLCGGDSPDEYLKAVGYGFVLRTVASYASPRVYIELSGEGVLIQTSVAILQFETVGKFGMEFDEEPPDHQKCKTMLYVNGDALMQIQRWEDKKTVIKRYVDEQDQMIMELQIGQVKCRRVFIRLP